MLGMRAGLEQSAATMGSAEGWVEFFRTFDRLMALEVPWTLQLRCPLGNSGIGPRPGSQGDADPGLESEDYTRGPEEDEALGITDVRNHEELERILREAEGA